MSLSSAPATSGVVRDAIDVRRLPWIRPLVGAYATDFASVAPLFAGNPADPAAWQQTIARVQRAPRDRQALVALLRRQLDARAAPAEARAAVDTLADPASVAVVTGQQAGLFGGPLYTLLKAVTAIQLARRIAEEHGTPAVPVFWVDEEDHDWDEIRSAQLLDAEQGPRLVTLADLPGARERTISSLVLDDGINDALAELEQLLTGCASGADVLAQLRQHYRPGIGMSTAFAGWIESLLGRHGLVVFQSADPAAKPLVGDLFVRELEHPGRTTALARQAAEDMRRMGHEPQVEPGDDSVALFYVDEHGRHSVKHRGGEFVVGDQTRPPQALLEMARTSPERFSPNVLLRPIVQDRLFPNVCYVGGPSELAYQAQLKRVYQEFGVELPLLYSRGSATLLESSSVRFLDRHHLPLEALQGQDDLALNKLLESQLPPSIERALEESTRDIATRADAMKKEVAALDPTLAGAVDTTADHMRQALDTLRHKIIHAAKRKDETLRRQFLRTRNLGFPGGHPQERCLNVTFALSRYGVTVCDRLLESMPLDTSKHYVLTL
jgi:bacillithiol biosynthesis cysteine-adding enzyme BshC